MIRRASTCLSAALLCGACAAPEGGANSEAPRPNIVLVMTDDQGYGDLSCFGHPTIHTPHLDQMAHEGQKWTNFYAAASVAVCGFAFVNPSVSAIISRRADADRQGEVLGVNQSFASLARILGPLTGLTLFSLHPSHALPYAAAVVALLVVAGLLPRIAGEPNASLTGHPH